MYWWCLKRSKSPVPKDSALPVPYFVADPIDHLFFFNSFAGFVLPLLFFMLARSAASAIDPGSAGCGPGVSSTESPLDCENRRASQCVGRAGRGRGSGGTSFMFSVNRATFGG